MPTNFQRYARYYDLVNADKPYGEEAAYVAARLRAVNPAVSTVLELGSGTGRHGRLLAAQGLRVCGIELSADMAELARDSSAATGSGTFECHLGDIRHARLNRKFDAVVALFHVMSYQVSIADVDATFSTASHHLDPGGLFLFDVWHGPAVLSQKPGLRERSVTDGGLRITRKAIPELKVKDNVVVVNFGFTIEHGPAEPNESFEERHVMRYFFPEEILAASARASFSCLGCEEIVTGAPPSEQTWAVTYLLQKQ